MTTRKVISGLPVYNGEKFIAAAIESHLAQTYGDFELVISDNGSTDSTVDICSEYARKDDRITLVRSRENRGILWNHRRVMEAITSPDQYFRWAAADDIMEPGLLEAMVHVLDAHADVEAVVPDTKNIDEAGNLVGAMARALDLRSPSAQERARHVLYGVYQMVIAFGLFRASTLKRLRTRPDYIGWDFVFVWELALYGKMFQPTGPVLLRRYHPGAMSHVKTATDMKKWVEPNSKAGMSFPHWTWMYERVRSLMAAPIPIRERLRIGAFLARAELGGRDFLVGDVTQAARRTLRLSDKYTF